jgi:hypothetical protein
MVNCFESLPPNVKIISASVDFWAQTTAPDSEQLYININNNKNANTDGTGGPSDTEQSTGSGWLTTAQTETLTVSGADFVNTANRSLTINVAGSIAEAGDRTLNLGNFLITYRW